MFVKTFNKCLKYQSDNFTIELTLDGDDVYPPDTLLFKSKDTFYNEIDLRKWDNHGFKEFIDAMTHGIPSVFQCNVHHSLIPMTIKYEKNIFTMQLREGDYWTDDIQVEVNDTVINDLSLMANTINDIKKIEN